MSSRTSLWLASLEPHPVTPMAARARMASALRVRIIWGVSSRSVAVVGPAGQVPQVEGPHGEALGDGEGHQDARPGAGDEVEERVGVLGEDRGLLAALGVVEGL